MSLALRSVFLRYQLVKDFIEVIFLQKLSPNCVAAKNSNLVNRIHLIQSLREAAKMSNLEAFEAEARKLMDEAVTLLVNKRRDYGSNALKGGTHGIAIRMSDKMGRLENLLGIADGSFKSKDAIVGDEKIEDTIKDILNYSILFLMEARKPK